MHVKTEIECLRNVRHQSFSTVFFFGTIYELIAYFEISVYRKYSKCHLICQMVGSLWYFFLNVQMILIFVL